jgi:hypothetical protein
MTVLTLNKSNSDEQLIFIKQNNEELEDYSIIENCFSKNIFLRNLGKSAR